MCFISTLRTTHLHHNAKIDKIDWLHSGRSLRTTRSVHCHCDGLQFLLLSSPDGDPCRYLTAVQRLVANPDRCGTRDKKKKCEFGDQKWGRGIGSAQLRTVGAVLSLAVPQERGITKGQARQKSLYLITSVYDFEPRNPYGWRMATVGDLTTYS